MSKIHQSCRPKHQVLVLKCYPRYQKNVADVKPNSSELSYLLYYASTRRSKVSKVCSFLEKKARNDVAKPRPGNVQVTLQILRALIEKSPRDLPLYAPYIMNILELVLHSRDISMVEDSIPTFDAFCTHHDMATLASDQDYLQKYEQVVRSYASLASGSLQPQEKISTSAPVALRWRSTGLRAIKSITSSEVLSADGGRQLNIVIPIVLQNLYSDGDDHLWNLQQKAQLGEKSERESAMKRRMSMATVQTVDTIQETNLASLSATTADADRAAEEEVQIVALQSLKQVFMANGKGQIRLATAAMLRFLTNKAMVKRPKTDGTTGSEKTGTWATTLVEMVAQWTPVQDRFVILVTAMENLVRSPTLEENLEHQLVLVTLVGWLLGSSINMIGLSVMDVLLGLIQHILLLLQLGGGGIRTSILPHHQQVDALNLFNDSQEVLAQAKVGPLIESPKQDDILSPSQTRQELLGRLQRCVGDLATHIYYSDQISDMVAAILARLKPSPTSVIKSTAAAIEQPGATAQAISESAHLQEDPNTDAFFSFGTARVTALNAVREVLVVANMKGSVTGAGAVGRNKVGMQVWEGTQWLLRDEDRRVRRAYVDALLTWLRLEVGKNDRRVGEEKKDNPKSEYKNHTSTEQTASMTRRAVSNPLHKNGPTRSKQSTFLQLLHLAVYDNALESPESDSEILLLHLLLAKLVEKLGVHAVKAGLPMMMRLQEDINIDSLVRTPVAKLNVGSLVHGYLWALSEAFDLDTTLVGYEIQSEVARRKKLGLWIDGVRIPPLPLESISSSAAISAMQKSTLSKIQSESLKPFDSCSVLVDRIAASYSASIASPPASPPGSPGRVFNMPILANAESKHTGPSTNELPASFQEAMLSGWTKDGCVASLEKDNARKTSINGSRSGTNRSGPNGFLGVNGLANTGRPSFGADSPAQTLEHDGDPPLSSHQHAPKVLSPNMASQSPNYRHSGVQDTGSPTPLSSSDHQPVVRVGDLKRVLAGGALASAFRYSAGNSEVRGSSPLRNSKTAYHDFAARTAKDDKTTPPRSQRGGLSSGSESMASAEGFQSASEGDLERPMPAPQTPLDSSELAHIYSQELDQPSFEQTPVNVRPGSRPQGRVQSRNRARTSSSASEAHEDPEANAKALKGELVIPISPRGNQNDFDDVPPVPPLPPNISLHNNITLKAEKNMAKGLDTTMAESGGTVDAPGRVVNRHSSAQDLAETKSVSATSDRTASKKRPDVRQLLEGVVTEKSAVMRTSGTGRPPY